MIEKFIKDNIHYIKETLPNGATTTYPDPDFQTSHPEPPLPPLPPLINTGQMLKFIIEELHLKRRFQPPP